MCRRFHYSLFGWMVHVSAPYSKILSTVERKKLIFNLRGKSDFHMLSSFRIAAQASAFLLFMSFSELSTQEPKYLKSFTFLSGFSSAITVSFLGFGVLQDMYSVLSSFMLRPTSLAVLFTKESKHCASSMLSERRAMSSAKSVSMIYVAGNL